MQYTPKEAEQARDLQFDLLETLQRYKEVPLEICLEVLSSILLNMAVYYNKESQND